MKKMILLYSTYKSWNYYSNVTVLKVFHYHSVYQFVNKNYKLSCSLKLGTTNLGLRFAHRKNCICFNNICKARFILFYTLSYTTVHYSRSDRKTSCFFRITHSFQFYKYSLARLSLHIRAYLYRKFAHTYACAHSAHVLAFARVLIRARGMKRDGATEKGKERTAGEARFSLRGWGFGLGSPAALPFPPTRSIPAASLIVIASLLLPSPARGRGETVECGARDGRGSILRRVEGEFGRLWHAHTPLEQEWTQGKGHPTPIYCRHSVSVSLCWYSSSSIPSNAKNNKRYIKL